MHSGSGKSIRVTKRKDIERIFDVGTSARDGMLTIVAAPNGLPYARLAVGVSKRHGGAVRRNRIKRLCREAFRLSRGRVPSGRDYMLIPRPGRAATLAELTASVAKLAERLAAAGEAEQ